MAWHILIIDDDEVDRMAVRRVLEAADRDIEILEASDGGSGLQIVMDGGVDCVLLDFRLPDMDGLAFLRAMGSEGDRFPCPVVMMTGEGNEEIAVEAMRLGVEDYMVKTASRPPDWLIERIGRAIDNWRTLRDKERAEQALKDSHAELAQFAYVASHDLQEPLRMVTSYLQLLEKRYDGQLDDTGKEYIGFAVDGAKRMRSLIRDLLRFSRITRAEDPFVPVDIGQIVKAACDDLRNRIDDSRARITWDGLPTLVADEIQMVRLFDNLIGNALKYRRPDVAPDIRVSARMKSGLWEFSVRDNGIGIDPDQHDRIFMVFQRLHGRGEYDGTGIGLAIARKIVERHGGRIWVESRPGDGSDFRFTLSHNSTVLD